MGSAASFLLTYAVIILIADLTLGIGVGWWLRGGNLGRKSAAAQQQHTQHVLQALHRLQELTSDVAGHIGLEGILMPADDGDGNVIFLADLEEFLDPASV